MSRTGSPLALLLLAMGVASAQPITRIEQMPPLDRVKEDFYGAIVGTGPRVQVEWLLAPASVPRGGDAILTLVVSHAANPTELHRPPLKTRPEFRDLFEPVEDLPDAPVDENTRRVEFRYRLRPRNEGTFELPVPKYRYYFPQLPEGRRFQLASAPPVTLTVTKAVPKVEAAVPLTGPAEFFRVRPAGMRPPTSLHWIALAVVPPLAGIVWVVAWRRLYPDEARLARLRRVRAVRTALRDLRRAESGEAVARVFRRYLIERLGVPVTAQTPREVAASLPNAADAEGILNECDRARFSGMSADVATLRQSAEAWVVRHEAGAVS